MAHYLFNFSDGDREQATALLRAKMWRVRSVYPGESPSGVVVSHVDR